MKRKEPTITIKGVTLTQAQAMTLRVSLESFAYTLGTLGENEGKGLKRLYAAHIRSLRKLMLT